MTLANEEGPVKNKWTMLAFLCAIFVLYTIDRAMLGLLAVSIQAETGLSNVKFGVLSAAIFWTYAVCVPFYEQPVEVLDWGIDVNLKGAIYFARACMPQMVAKKGGVIVCLGSVTGVEGDGVGTMYGTAKSGLFNFVKGLAVAGGPHNVRAVCVTPGPILTRAAMSGMPTILGRAGETHELVDVILFMCSENASFITGTNHIVDGGRLLMFQPYVAPKNV